MLCEFHLLLYSTCAVTLFYSAMFSKPDVNCYTNTNHMLLILILLQKNNRVNQIDQIAKILLETSNHRVGHEQDCRKSKLNCIPMLIWETNSHIFCSIDLYL